MANVPVQTRQITVLYFAAAQTAAGLAAETIDLPAEMPDFKLSNLGSLIMARHPNSNLDRVLSTSQWSVDAEMVDEPEGVVLKGGEEVAVICPVSGG